jgi:hypothetical protein
MAKGGAGRREVVANAPRTAASASRGSPTRRSPSLHAAGEAVRRVARP